MEHATQMKASITKNLVDKKVACWLVSSMAKQIGGVLKKLQPLRVEQVVKRAPKRLIFLESGTAEVLATGPKEFVLGSILPWEQSVGGNCGRQGVEDLEPTAVGRSNSK
eukprot:4559836-Pleurochrysis_carterae.AAC.1